MSHVNRPGMLISYIGGIKKEFPFNRTDPKAKKAAEAARLESDSQVQRAINQRCQQLYGRSASQSELRRGLKLEDMRSISDQVRQDGAQVRTGRDNLVEVRPGFHQRDANDNYWRRYVADLEARLLRAPHNSRGSIEMALVHARQRADAFDSAVAIRKESEARSEAVADLVALNQGWIHLLNSSPDGADQEFLEAAKQAHSDLLKTGDRDAFYQATDAWQSKRRAAHTAKIQALEESANQFSETVKRAKALAEESPLPGLADDPYKRIQARMAENQAAAETPAPDAPAA